LFLVGVKEFTYGNGTNFIFAMDLGDGLLRHPTSLYELVFLFDYIKLFLLKL